jgi:hypothetical protein
MVREILRSLLLIYQIRRVVSRVASRRLSWCPGAKGLSSDSAQSAPFTVAVLLGSIRSG